jgi:hypothetical protein
MSTTADATAAVTDTDSMHRTLDAALFRQHTETVHHCPACGSDNTRGHYNSEGHYHGHCINCWMRFWA